jgi:S1-C subfamily serine protease
MNRRLTPFVLIGSGFLGGFAAVAVITPNTPVGAQSPLPGIPRSIDDTPTRPAPTVVEPSSGLPRFDAVVQKVMPSVVSVDAAKPAVKGKAAEESGSGVLMKFDGFRGTYAVTNNHVVDGSRAADVTVTLNDGRILIPDRVWTDPASDIAVLRIDAENMPVAELGDSDLVKPGHWVLAFGSPLGFNQTVTHGIISARDRGQVNLNNTIRIKEFLQSDAAINPGSSGGPLTDATGRVIGINTAIASGGAASTTFTGISFSIPINLVKRLGKELLETGKVQRGYLGLQMAPTLDAQTALKLGLTKLRGAMVESTHPNGPSARGGLQAGDVIQQVDGVPVRDENHFINIVGSLPIGQTVRLTVWRSKQPKAVELTVSDWPTTSRR